MLYICAFDALRINFKQGAYLMSQQHVQVPAQVQRNLSGPKTAETLSVNQSQEPEDVSSVPKEDRSGDQHEVQAKGHRFY